MPVCMYVCNVQVKCFMCCYEFIICYKLCEIVLMSLIFILYVDSKEIKEN